MSLALASLQFLSFGILIPALLANRPRFALRLSLLFAWIGSAVGIVAALRVLLGSPAVETSWNWGDPLGAVTLGLDPLSAFFLIPILGVTAVAALAGHGALMARAAERRAVAAACLSNALTASMVVLVLARETLVFLVAWELMSLTSYFLVTLDDEDREVQTAGFIYLVATHVGTAFLLVFFVRLGLAAGSFAFAGFAATPLPAATRHLLFALALVGFGAKAGIAPLHVWLPRAHPAAPSHVSAVMSGVMIKMGIYGLLRALSFLTPWPAAWGYALLLLGALSAVGGALFALAQRDLKRMLAYSSVENVGIVTLGLGAGILGTASNHPAVAALGFAGAMLHVWNHAAFKSLLFIAAGALVHATHERHADRLGGLLGRMPATGVAFLVGVVALCGLPPLNGFVGEWLLYWGFFTAGTVVPGWPAMASWLAAAGLALASALALACFGGAFGLGFLGQPRGAEAAGAHETDSGSRVAMAALALTCVWAGVLPAPLIHGAAAGLRALLPVPTLEATLAPAASAAAEIGIVSLGVLLFAAVLALARVVILRRRIERRPTWGCGYAWPTPRMQYSGSSFVQPLLELFRGLVPRTEHREPVEGWFPQRASLTATTDDPAERRLFRPAFDSLPELLGRFRWMQAVPIQVQILYLLIGLVALIGLGLGGLARLR